LRIGRQAELEVAIDDLSVSRLHAEILLDGDGWVIRDRGSSNGTIVNGVRIGRSPQPLRQGDTIQLGKLTFRVEELQTRPVAVRIGQQTVHVEASARRTWSEAVDQFEPPEERTPHNAQGFLRLLRGGYRLAHPMRAQETLQEVLNDATAFFKARRIQ
jgi:pSer/pThr/pTyr-binding forkhead associated (FHA) protein